jgi:Rrf2 family cysteine metabolism transcriptional repressor
MVRISTRGRYALRAMVDLAQHHNGTPVPRQDIAGRQEISADYVAQLFRQLQAEGLVRSVKGPGGGYLLGQEPAQVSAGDIVRAVEGPLALVDCTVPDAEGEPVCSREEGCVTHLVWNRLAATVSEFLDAISLQDLADEAAALSPALSGASQ